LGIVIAVAVVYGRALVESRSALNLGEAALATDVGAAHTHLRHAVEWYAPANPFSRTAADRLLELGLDAAPDDERRTEALSALESLRSGIMVTRGLYTPYSGHVDQAEAQIARLRGFEAAGGDADRLDSEVERQLALLQSSRARAPSPGWSLVTTGSFVGWLLLTAVLVRRRGTRVWPARAGWVACLAGWIVGLSLV